jgi:uncharacterized membrane protein YhaH (DUF805 family)
MGSVFTGWWSWLVALWALAAFTFSVIALLGDDGDEEVVYRVAFALVLLGLAAVTAAALVVRRKAPRLAAWLLIVGVGLPGLPGIGSVWMLIPTAIALVIIVGGVITGEIRFTRPKRAGAGQG